MFPVDSSTRVLELLVLLDQQWSFSQFKAPICLLSRTGSEMLTFVRSMMEWLGGTIGKEDPNDRAGEGKSRKRKYHEEEQDTLGTLALRFK
jgi:cleavage and polyadenylation specificity factor subunit 2